jgi:hypothetical protein
MKLQASREEVVILHQEDAIGEDGRVRRLPLPVASLLMAEGYGFGAECWRLFAELLDVEFVRV